MNPFFAGFLVFFRFVKLNPLKKRAPTEPVLQKFSAPQGSIAREAFPCRPGSDYGNAVCNNVRFREDVPEKTADAITYLNGIG
jgi:hypothetical protein